MELSPALTIVPGAILGHRQLLVPLGQGGAGSVWVAREQSPVSGKERLIAVKVLRPEFASLSNFRAMFLAEGQLAKRIEHENVVRVFDVFEHAGVLSIAMEWVEGESLDALFIEATRRRPIPHEMAVRIIADTAKGLHAAHEVKGWDGELAGIVHRDVSPHNILIGVGGQIKVADFGLAKAADGSGMDFGDTPHGKYGYLSPEQARGQAIDRRSDVFSLGVVLYELTTGRRLFQGEDRHHTLGLVMQCKVPSPSAVSPSYPPGLEAIVLKALSNKPNERHQSADELRVALEKYLVQERTLVSTGSVSALLKRVLGQRLQARREAINQALIATGHANTDLLPETSLLTGMSQASEVTAPRERILSSHPASSETPHAVSHSQTSMPALAPRMRRSTKRTAVIGGGAAVGVFVLMLGLGKMLQEEPSIVQSGAANPEPATNAAAAADSPQRPTVEGLSVDDLPVEVEKERARAQRRAAAQFRPAAPATAAPAPAKAPDWLKQAQAGDGEESPVAENAPASAKTAPPSEAPDESASASATKPKPAEPEAAPEADAPPEDSTEPDTGEKPQKVINNPYLKQPGF